MSLQEKQHKILLVDDEADILEFIRYNLEREGYLVQVADNGVKAIEVARTMHPDLILLDVMMPEMDGIETCIEIRRLESINPVIAFLTARGEDYSQIAGFNAGADDYITKPIKPQVLSSRVKALLRRSGADSSSDSKNLTQGIHIDRERYLVISDGKELTLPKKEFELIALLASKPGKVFTRDTIYNEVWGNDVIVGDRTIDVHIRKLREKIGDSYIRTVKGVGYRFEQ